MRFTLEFYETLEKIRVLGISKLTKDQGQIKNKKNFLVVDRDGEEVRSGKGPFSTCLRAVFR